MAQTSISVVVPVFNHARFLPRSLGAIVSQTHPPSEVIVIDDGSADDSAAVAETFRSRLHPTTRFVVLRSVRNQGVNRAINEALGEVSSEWTCCSGADDWLESRFIERMTVGAKACQHAGIVTSQYVEHLEAENRMVVHDHRSELGTWYARSEIESFSVESFRQLLRKGYVGLQLNASILRTRHLKAQGGFDPALRWHADWFVAYVLASRFGFGAVSEPLAAFRLAAGTYSGDNVDHFERQREVSNAILDKLRSREFWDFRKALKATPAPFSPFVRHMLPALSARSDDRDLFRSVLLWWMGEVLRGRRPGGWRRFATRLGLTTVPHI